MSLESNLHRIISGKMKYEEGRDYIHDPSFFVLKIGRIVYDECLDFIEDNIVDDRQIQILLNEMGVWSYDKEQKLQELPKTIENNKVFYFQNYKDPTVRKKYKNAVDMSISEFMSLTKVRYKYQHLTAEGVASTAMWTEMINHMYKGPNKMRALGYYHMHQLKDEDVRDIALSYEWNSYSALSKNPFGRASIKMTELQRKLLSWTNIYRNVRSHSEFPGDKVLADHNAFDGWMILLNRKEAAEKGNKTVINSLKPNTRNVFMGQATRQEQEEIMALNTPEALARMKAEEYEISKHG